MMRTEELAQLAERFQIKFITIKPCKSTVSVTKSWSIRWLP